MKKENLFLFNYVFIVGLVIMFMNDHFLKLTYSNWVTGKLSDFIGLIITPMVLSYFFPRNIKVNVALVGVFFIYWKSSFSQSFIDFYNQYSIIQITRVVDYTDLFALSSLIFSYKVLNNPYYYSVKKTLLLKLKPIFILIPSIFIFLATSPPRHYWYTFSNGKIKFHKCYKTVRLNEEEILHILNNSYNLKVDTHKRDFHNLNYYEIDTVFLDKDTILNFQFSLQKISDEKTKIWINGMNPTEEIPDSLVTHKLRKYYSKAIKENFKSLLK